MWPLFQKGDLLAVKVASQSSIGVGDCVVFRGSADNQFFVHRVVAMTPKMLTRGDNRPCEDDEPLSEESLVGKVAARIRGGRTTKVHGGVAGRIAGKLVRLAGLLDPTRNARGGAIARLVRSQLRGVGQRYLHRTQIVHYTTAGGHKEMHLTLERRLIAEYDSESRKWRVCWPYLLLIDPDTITMPTKSRAPA